MNTANGSGILTALADSEAPQKQEAQLQVTEEKPKGWKKDIFEIFPTLREGIKQDEIETWINELRSVERAKDLGCVWVVKCGKSYGRYPRKLELICTKQQCQAYFNLRAIDNGPYYLEEDRSYHDTHKPFSEEEIQSRVSRIKCLKGTRVRKPKHDKKDKEESSTKEDDESLSDASIIDESLKSSSQGNIQNKSEEQLENQENGEAQEEKKSEQKAHKRRRRALHRRVLPSYDGGEHADHYTKIHCKYMEKENELLKKCLKQQEEMHEYQKREFERAKQLIMEQFIKIRELEKVANKNSNGSNPTNNNNINNNCLNNINSNISSLIFSNNSIGNFSNGVNGTISNGIINNSTINSNIRKYNNINFNGGANEGGNGFGISSYNNNGIVTDDINSNLRINNVLNLMGSNNNNNVGLQFEGGALLNGGSIMKNYDQLKAEQTIDNILCQENEYQQPLDQQQMEQNFESELIKNNQLQQSHQKL